MFIDGLDAATRAAFEAKSIADSKQLWGVELTLADNINMCIGAKFVSAVDGFSQVEQERMVALMKGRGAPDEVCEYVAAFDTTAISAEHLIELFGRSPAHAKFLVLGALVVAVADGISEQEMALVSELGARLGLPEVLVRAFAADAELTVAAERRSDSEGLEQLLALRVALFSLG